MRLFRPTKVVEAFRARGRLYLETMDEVLSKNGQDHVGADSKSVDLQFVSKK
jgi:hypothetical protein